jgi:hypothetical protein
MHLLPDRVLVAIVWAFAALALIGMAATVVRALGLI